MESVQAIALRLSDVSTETADYRDILWVYTNPADPTGSRLEVVDGQVQVPALTTTLYVAVQTVADEPRILEGAEDLQLAASFVDPSLRYANRESGAERSGASQQDTATILDNGRGKVYGPDGRDTGALPDDDTPPAPLPKAIDPAPTPAAEPAPVAEQPRAPLPLFNSALQPASQRQGPDLNSQPIGDILTSNSGFRIVVNEAASPGLNLYRGITDQFVQENSPGAKVNLPADAFVHSDENAVVKLEAKQADNSSLPSWVRFDAATGSFEVTPPATFRGKLDLKVIARDDKGNEATALFRLFVGEPTEPVETKPQSRQGLSEKLRLAAKRAPMAAPEVVLQRVSAPVPAPVAG
jgi:hypothetical protein